jgi:hypothetical protein
MRKTLAFAVATTLLFAAGAARAEITQCTAIVPPVTISSPGIYCLRADYALSLASGTAIAVSANNVVIDFNGHRIGNVAAGASNLAAGVGVQMSLQNLTVRNGTLRGFHTAVSVGGPSQGVLVEDMLLDQSLYAGVYMTVTGSIVRRNRVIATGSWGTDAIAGLIVQGDGNRILDNDISDTTAPTWDFVAGITLSGNHFVVAGNRITGVAALAGATTEFGIRAIGKGMISDNIILDDDLPAGSASYGIAALSSGIKMVGNKVMVPLGGTAYSGGTQVSGTNN